MARLPREFYEGRAEAVARALLGKIFVRLLRGAALSGRIVETEAYLGESDPGSHAFRGATARNRVMFGAPGHLYVYVSYGMHACMNVVTDPPGVAGAVLIRALEPLEGVPIMEKNRGGRSGVELSNGPGKLCQALGITPADNGADLLSPTLWIEDGGFARQRVESSSRIGLSAGRELPLRFFLGGNPFVSRGRPSAEIQPVRR